MNLFNKNPYIQLLRVGHWFKNLFLVFGVLLAVWYTETNFLKAELLVKIVGALILASFISSANYIVNQLADTEFDAQHIEKKDRPIPSGKISPKVALILSLILFSFGMIMSIEFFDLGFQILLFCLWVAGIMYNLPPFRFKDIPFIDVLAESINNPIRFLLGWYSIVSVEGPSVLVLLFTWMLGATLMTAKRYDELLYFGKKLIPYRKTFKSYTLGKLKFLLYAYSVLSLLLLGYLVWQYEQKILLVIPIAVLFNVWLIEQVLSGKAQARSIESFVLSRRFVALSFGLMVIFLFLLLFNV